MIAFSELLILTLALLAVVVLAAALGALSARILEVKYLLEHSKAARCPPDGPKPGVPVASCVVLRYVGGDVVVEVYYVNVTLPG